MATLSRNEILFYLEERPKKIDELRNALTSDKFPERLAQIGRLLLQDPMRLSPQFFCDRVDGLLESARKSVAEKSRKQATDPLALRQLLEGGLKYIKNQYLVAEIKVLLERFKPSIDGGRQGQAPLQKGKAMLTPEQFRQRSLQLVPLVEDAFYEHKRATEAPPSVTPLRKQPPVKEVAAKRAA